MGYPYAQYQLGINYCNGTGFKQDVKKGIDYITKASKKNISRAYKALGDITFFGYYGYQKDPDHSIKNYTAALNCTDDIPGGVYLNLSRCYQQKKNYSAALNLLEKGAEINDADCQNEIGLFYESGLGVNKNLETAISYYKKAAENQNALAVHRMAVAYETGEGVPKDTEQAVRLYKSAAEDGVPSACYKYGLLCESQEKYSQAKEWYEKAAAKNHILAYNNLGMLYEKGKLGKADYYTAEKMYYNAAQAGNAIAQNNLGCLYYNHYNFYDLDRALKYFKAAADQGYIPARENYKLALKRQKTNKVKRIIGKL